MGLNLAVILFSSLFPFLAVYLYFVAADSTAGTQLLYGSTKLLQFGFPILIWWVRGENIKDKFKLRSLTTNERRELIFTISILLVMATVGYFVFIRNHIDLANTKLSLIDRLNAFGANTWLKFIFLATFISIIHSFLEEYYWRMFVLVELEKYCAARSAAIISGVAFTLHHIIVINKYAQTEPRWIFIVLGTLTIFTIGLVWANQFQRVRKLRMVWLSHIVADLILMTIGYDIAFVQ